MGKNKIYIPEYRELIKLTISDLAKTTKADIERQAILSNVNNVCYRYICSEVGQEKTRIVRSIVKKVEEGKYLSVSSKNKYSTKLKNYISIEEYCKNKYNLDINEVFNRKSRNTLEDCSSLAYPGLKPFLTKNNIITMINPLDGVSVVTQETIDSILYNYVIVDTYFG